MSQKNEPDIRFSFWKRTNDGQGIMPTTEDDKDAQFYEVSYIAGDNAGNAISSQVKVKKDDRGFWMIEPWQFRSILTYFWRKGRQEQAIVISDAINYKVLR